MTPITRRRVGHVDHYVARESGMCLLRSTRRCPYQAALWCAQTPQGEPTGWVVSFHSTRSLAERALAAWRRTLGATRLAKARMEAARARPDLSEYQRLCAELNRLEAIWEHLVLIDIETLTPAPEPA